MSKKILLADDSLTIQKVISITLASEDYDLEIVGDGNAAIAKAKTFQPDLILADVAMPGKNGYEVCEIIKKDPALSKIPVLLLAGTFEPLNREEAGRVKADDSIIKPFESSSFVDKVRSLLAKAQAEAAPKEVEVTELPEVKPEITGNVWEAGDFLGTPEEEQAQTESGADDMDFLGGGLFDEAIKEADEETPGQVTPDQAFMDLDLNAPPKPAKKAAPPPPPQRPAAQAPPAAPQRPAAPPPRPVAPPPPPLPEVDFNAFSSEPPAAPQEEDVSSYWTQGEAVAPSAPPPPAPPPLRTPPAPPAREARREPVAPPARRPPSEGGAPDLLKLYQKQGQAQPPAAARPVERAVEKTVAAASERINVKDVSGLTSAVTSAFSREEIQEIIRKTAREVIEEIAWEVVPELTEEIVNSEMSKFRESFLKSKEKKA
ncbi:MAG: response regulator [Deltaproteobacteria bacterium]|nr:response regulator [Deltaproteobacteria bacterium]